MANDVEVRIAALEERDRAMHLWMNKVHARLNALEKQVGNPHESFNDLSLKASDAIRRITALEKKDGK